METRSSFYRLSGFLCFSIWGPIASVLWFLKSGDESLLYQCYADSVRHNVALLSKKESYLGSLKLYSGLLTSLTLSLVNVSFYFQHNISMDRKFINLPFS